MKKITMYNYTALITNGQSQEELGTFATSNQALINAYQELNAAIANGHGQYKYYWPVIKENCEAEEIEVDDDFEFPTVESQADPEEEALLEELENCFNANFVEDDPEEDESYDEGEYEAEGYLDVSSFPGGYEKAIVNRQFFNSCNKPYWLIAKAKKGGEWFDVLFSLTDGQATLEEEYPARWGMTFELENKASEKAMRSGNPSMRDETDVKRQAEWCADLMGDTNLEFLKNAFEKQTGRKAKRVEREQLPGYEWIRGTARKTATLYTVSYDPDEEYGQDYVWAYVLGEIVEGCQYAFHYTPRRAVFGKFRTREIVKWLQSDIG